jgi:glycosyltransferase involved in cell wall biosynthesis
VTTSLRVLVDATAIPRDLGGVGRYLQELLPALDAEEAIELVIAAQERDAPWIGKRAKSATIHAVPERSSGRLPRLAWEQLGLPRLAGRVRADVIHSPHYTMPLAAGVPVVVTLHDATFFSHPRLHTPVKRTFFRRWSRYSAKHAAAVVVPSRATRDELVRFARLDADSAIVAYHGVDPASFHVPTESERRKAAEKLSLPAGGWVSFLGTIEPRKNVPSLVTAYASLASDRRMPPLVIGGAAGWDRETGELVAGLGTDVDIRLLGYVAAELLPGLLGGSTVFVYPSLGEGFGLPVLEAMSCGAPTLTTRMLAIPEVGGDAVEYTEPTAKALAASLARLLDDEPRRRELAAAGPARASDFTWTRSAAAHIDAYRLAVNS